jgi:nitrogen regulatory protein PII
MISEVDTMAVDHRKLVTVVTEAALEHELTADLLRLGVSGFTVTDARGKGGRGVRNASWGPSANIRVEVVCNDSTAAAIATVLRERYYDNYAMILFVTDVAVLRPAKF